MVTRNRGEGDASPWWDDLPPKVRARFSVALSEPLDEAPPRPGSAPTDRPGFLADITRLAVAFAFVTVAILLYLLVVVSYVTS